MSERSMSEVRVGLLGVGQVGGGVLRLVSANGKDIEARLGAKIRVVRAAVRDVSRVRVPEAAGVELTTDPRSVVEASDIDVVVEVIGGIEPARTLVLEALRRGRSVVTANKALLAAHGDELAAAASEAGVDLLFEGAVCGGVPVIRTLREALASDRIESIRGIVNGTTNFILSRMEQGGSYVDALKQAQELGFAEADPTFDVSGRDAAQKLLLLAKLAFGARLAPDDVPAIGIEHVEAADFAYAREFSRTIKLVATARREGDRVALGVRPTLVPIDSLLGTVRGATNAVEIRSYALGSTVLVGPGAGALPTGSAVVSDIIEAARNQFARAAGRVPHLAFRPDDGGPTAQAPGSQTGAWYLRFHVADEPGVLAKIAGTLGARRISIASVIQRDRAAAGGAIPVVVVTHEARESEVTAAAKALDAEPFSRGPARVLPMESA